VGLPNKVTRVPRTLLFSAGVLAVLWACEPPAERQESKHPAGHSRAPDTIALTMKHERDEHDRTLADLRRDAFEHAMATDLAQLDARVEALRIAGRTSDAAALSAHRSEVVSALDVAAEKSGDELIEARRDIERSLRAARVMHDREHDL